MFKCVSKFLKQTDDSTGKITKLISTKNGLIHTDKCKLLLPSNTYVETGSLEFTFTVHLET